MILVFIFFGLLFLGVYSRNMDIFTIGLLGCFVVIPIDLHIKNSNFTKLLKEDTKRLEKNNEIISRLAKHV